MKYPDDFIDKVICGDCLEVMKEIPDNSVDLVLTDPPYGILNGITSFCSGKGKSMAIPRKTDTKWDKKITNKYFEEIMRVSLNQIIFGFEHYATILPNSRGIYCWDKQRPPNTDYGEFELIWTSFNKRPEFIRYTWHGMIKEGNDIIVHSTQKPIFIMSCLLTKHSNDNTTILDPFLGSGTTAVACKQLNRHFIGIEINPDYCKIARERLMGVPDSLFK